MKPGGGGIQPETTSLVVQVNSTNTNNYGSSPNKKKEDEETEGTVERRPKFYKHLPLNYQHVLQDHNYCAMPPSPTSHVSPKPSHSTALPNGVSLSNGITRQPLPLPTPAPIPFFRSGYSRGVTPDAIRTNEIIRTRVDAAADESDISSDGEAPPENTEDGEETETAPEDEDSVTRCICDFQHDDGYMICCDKCLVWQHVDCMGIERGNIPEEYRCEECEPRKVDKARAIRLQLSKRNQFNDSSDSHESSATNTPPKAGRSITGGGSNTRKGSVARSVSRRRGERGGGKSGRWRTPSESKRGKYTKPTVKQKQKKAITKRNRETTSEKKEVAASSQELRSPSPSDNIHQLRQWIDSYEEAVTNHYSQELRARISAIKVNGLHSEFRLNSSSLPGTLKAKISLLPSGIKILVATAHIAANQAIIEVRGKYMLSKGGTVSQGNNKQQYIFHHKLNGPGTEVTEVQVDATTYGNDARFIRSSCTPNAQIRHCIEKGTLHLYIVSTSIIEAKTEITLPHRPGIGLCASGDKCTIVLSGNDKRRRGRRRTLSESSTSMKSSNLSVNNNNINNNNNNNNNKETPSKKPPPVSLSPEPSPVAAPKLAKLSSNSVTSPPLTRESSNKALRGQVNSRRATTPAAKSEERKRNLTASPPKKHDGKLTREERKMEAIIKAIERLEKDEQRKQLTTGNGTGRARKSSSSLSPVREKQEKHQLKKKSSRETRSSKALRPRRNTTVKSSAPPPRRITRRRAQSEETETDESDGVSVGGSAPPTPGTPPLPEQPYYEGATPTKEEEESVNQETLNSSGSDSTPPPAVSNACLLVAAAVGPLAPGFKFPKTKKNLLNSWFGGGEVSSDDVTPKAGVVAPLDCAKKRWLRQAISEDSDSPKQQEPGVVSPTEMAAPLKKRRFARESISSEMSYTPPETPQTGDAQTQLYEYDENSMEPQGSSEEAVAPGENNQQETTEAAGSGPRTPPQAVQPTSVDEGVPAAVTTPQKSPLSSSENNEDDKLQTPSKAKDEARVKRKLSISEYRERVKSNPSKSNSDCSQTMQTPQTPTTPVAVEEIDTDSDDFLSNSLIFTVPPPPLDPSFKKGPPSGFNAAPTLVEQQREALTERLRREFGLLLSDDEEEKNKKTPTTGGGEVVASSIGPPQPEIKKKRKAALPPPPPPPLPPLGHPPPPPPPTNDWMYYQRPQSQYRFTRTF